MSICGSSSCFLHDLTAYLFLLLFAPAYGERIDLFILAGQSNAQGWKGDAAQYPRDLTTADASIRLFWISPGISSSNGKWTTLRAQGGRFKAGHFGLEITFARAMKGAGLNPAIFKYTLGSTSLAGNWKAPGEHGMTDNMMVALADAMAQLTAKGHEVNVRGLIWIQGESDAKTQAMAETYRARLQTLVEHVREKTKTEKLPVVLGVDEQHPWVKKHPQVVQAQQALATNDAHIVFVSMRELEKADSTHLTPAVLEQHGKRIFRAMRPLVLPGINRKILWEGQKQLEAAWSALPTHDVNRVVLTEKESIVSTLIGLKKQAPADRLETLTGAAPPLPWKFTDEGVDKRFGS